MSEADFNCDCLDSTEYETLGQLRRRMMVRLGYAASADNPPPGMADLLNDFLQSAQRKLYTSSKNPEFRTTRMYRWTMIEGIGFYGLRDNDTSTEFTDITCGKHLDAYQVKWVGLRDLNGMWLPLVEGISPEFYTTVQQEGLPQRYEIHQCIEVFPRPNAAYELWVKGAFGLEPFTGDDDRTTIHSEIVFLTALADAKTHYGKGDAQAVKLEAQTFLADLKAGLHLTKRYIPTFKPLPPAVQPIATHYFPES